MSEPPDKPGSGAPDSPGETPRKTTTQPLAPVDPSEVQEAGFETTGTFRDTPLPGVPKLDAPFPPAPPPGPKAGAAPPPGPPRPAAPRSPATGGTALPRPGAAPGQATPPPRPGQPPGIGAVAPAPPPVPRTPTREQPAAGPPRTPTREGPAAPTAGTRSPPQAPLGSPTGEFLTEQARASGPAPQPGVVPARVFRPTDTPGKPAVPPLPSLGVSIAPVIPPLAPVKAGPPRTAAPRVPHRPTRDPMSETSIGIPVVPPLPPAEAGGPPPVAPVVPPVAPAATATPAPGDPESQVAWKAERLDTLDYFELLGVPTTASAGEVKRAFYTESRAYHPDRFFQLDDEAFKTRVHEVYKRVTEAYYVLRDDVRRKKYLADVSGPDRASKLRFDELSEKETIAQVKQQAAEQIGLNPKARQQFQTALGEIDRGNFVAAERGLKMALTYEPQNALYKEKLTEVQARLYEESRGKAFKIK